MNIGGKSSKGTILFVFSAIFLLLVIGCSQEPSEPNPSNEKGTAAPKTGGTITIAYEIEPDTLDTHKSNGGADLHVSWHLGGSLLYEDPVTHELKPYLAEEYKVSEDGKTLTFKIRSGITMHDGTPVTAKTFKETFERALKPEFKAGIANGVLAPVVTSVNAPDDRTLILQLKEPNAPLLENISTPVTQPLSVKAIETYGTEYGEHPVGVGPWKFESWKHGEEVTLIRNDSFKWAEPFFENQGPPRADKLVIKTILDKQTMMAALDSGSIDIAPEIPPKDVKKYKNNPKYEVLETLRTGMGLYMSLNIKNEALQDIQVRKAINMLVNKEAIIQAVLAGEGVVANGPLSPNMLGYDKAVEEYGYKYNPAEAKKLLHSSGWKVNGEGIREKNGKTLTLTLLSSGMDKQAQLIQAMLGEAGIKVTIQNLEFGTMMGDLMKGKFDLAIGRFTWGGPDMLYPMFYSTGTYNFSGIKDDKLDELLEKGNKTFDMEARKKIYKDAQKLIVEQAYHVPIYVDKRFTVVNTRVKGVKWIKFGLQFNDAWVDK